MAAELFVDERVKAAQQITTGDGFRERVIVEAGTEGRIVRERLHPIWRRCLIVYFERGVNGQPVYVYVPPTALKSLEKDRGKS